MNVKLDDETFNQIYPLSIQLLAQRHWTPVEVAKRAADYLVPFPGARVLDIGSGAGKFCLVGASCTNGHFTGVEQRKNLVELSSKIAIYNEIENACFIHANVTEIGFSGYDSFYFYNSFHENIALDSQIDDQVKTSRKHYAHYWDYMCYELSKKPAGTRLVTYWTLFSEIPGSYQLQFSAFDGLLHFWKKII